MVMVSGMVFIIPHFALTQESASTTFLQNLFFAQMAGSCDELESPLQIRG
jgi:hypothetical protein